MRWRLPWTGTASTMSPSLGCGPPCATSQARSSAKSGSSDQNLPQRATWNGSGRSGGAGWRRVMRKLGVAARLLHCAAMYLRRSLQDLVGLGLWVVAHDLVGPDAHLVDVAPVRSEVDGRRELESAAARQRQDALHQSLAERSRTDEEGPMVVLQSAGDDLRGALR